MNLLVDTLVRQSMVMIARLSTAGGIRAPLAHLAGQVFVDLTDELRAQGLGHKVIADMFGMTLRAYHAKVRRLNGELDSRSRSLWQAVADYLEAKSTVTRAEMLRRFRNDDQAQVISILNDLVSSGWVFRKGESVSTVYRLADERDLSSQSADRDAVASVLWVVLRRQGPLDEAELRAAVGAADPDVMREALIKLEEEQRIERRVQEGREIFSSTSCVIPLGSESGWMGSVVDHFNAVANTLCRRAERVQAPSRFDPQCGGSTFTFELDEEHPLWPEVLQRFCHLREETSELRQKVLEFNSKHPAKRPLQVTFYLGQNVLEEEPESPSPSDP